MADLLGLTSNTIMQVLESADRIRRL